MFKICVSHEKDPDFVSTEIMEFTKAPFSHIFVLVDNTWIYQATGKGFHKVFLSEFLESRVVVGEKEIQVQDPSYALGWLDGNIGKGYGHLQYVGFISKVAKRLLDNNSEKLICSEAVARFMEECCGIKLDGDYDYLSPVDVWEKIP